MADEAPRWAVGEHSIAWRGGLGKLELAGPGCRNAPRSHRAFASVSASAKVRAKDASSKVAAKPDGPEQTKPLRDVVAGALARAGSQATIHPIDTMKVRMQAGDMHNAAAASPISPRPSQCRVGGRVIASATVMSRVNNVAGDVRSLYKGVGSAAGAAGIIIGTYFAFYSTAKKLLHTHTNLPTGSAALISGSVAAVGSSAVKVPLAVCIRSVQAGVYASASEAATQITQKAGFRGLFTGFVPTLLEDVPDMAVKFAVYESLRPLHESVFHRKANTVEDLIMGGIAGCASAAVTTPLDVVKTRMMCSASRRPTIVSAFRETVQSKEGARALLRGIGPRCLSNGLNSAIFFCFFEAIRQAIGRMDEKNEIRVTYAEAGQ